MMCTYSMVVDARYDDWERRRQNIAGAGTWIPYTQTVSAPTLVTQQEIDEFRRLLDRAREYDKQHGEPDCELEEKRQRIKDLAEKLGVKVEFV